MVFNPAYILDSELNWSEIGPGVNISMFFEVCFKTVKYTNLRGMVC